MSDEFDESDEYDVEVDPYSLNYEFDIIITDVNSKISQECGTPANFIMNENLESFLTRLDIYIYLNGCDLKNKGFISFLLLENKKSHLNSEDMSYTLSCILNVTDVTGELRFPQSFAITRSAGKDETNTIEPFTPFGLERYVKFSTLFDTDEFIENDRLTIHCTFCGEEYFYINSVQARNLYYNMSCVESILPVRTSEGTTKYELQFETPLFEFLYSESRYFQTIDKTPMLESNMQSMYIPEDEYEIFCKLATFIEVGTLRHIESWEEFSELYVIADKYEILRLKEKCSDHLRKLIGLQSATYILALADMHNDQDLKTEVITYIKLFWDEIKSTNNWKCLMENEKGLAEEVLQEIEHQSSSSNNIEEQNIENDLEIPNIYS